jgi:glucose-1-phosphate adenylyltransferase
MNSKLKNTMGLILTGWRNSDMGELTKIRSSSAVPVAGKYRAIDFPLSNLINAGVTNIGILTQYSYRSLVDHLGSGKEWDLDRRQGGLFIFPPSLEVDGKGWYKGTADSIYHNIEFLKKSKAEYVILLMGNCVYKMDFRRLYKYHIEKNADITVCTRHMYDYSEEELKRMGIVTVDENNKITDLQEKPLTPGADFASLGIYLMKKQILINMIEEGIAHGCYEFVKDILVKKIHEKNVYSYEFKGYWRNLKMLKTYYKCNMELLDPDLKHRLFEVKGKVYTKIKDEVPAKYNEEANVKNSIVADGCIIEGTVIDSVLFRGVRVEKNAVIKNSIVMQDSFIKQNATLEYAILDKNVKITEGKMLKGDLNLPVIVDKNSVV